MLEALLSSRTGQPSAGDPCAPLLRGGLRLALFACTLLIFACGDEAAPPEAPVARPVKMLTVAGETEAGATEYPGRVNAFLTAEMAFEVSGRIIDFPFVEGDQIEKGTVIARLDPRDFEAKLKAAKANLTQAEADYERYQKLFAEGVTSKAELEAKKQLFEVRQAEIASAEKAIEDSTLTAPFSGTYAKKLVDDFQNVTAKEPVMILHDDSKLKIVVTVPESDMVGGLHGMTVKQISDAIDPEVFVSSMPDRAYEAELYELATTADTVTRTFDATFVLDSPKDASVFPGMTAKVRIHRRSRGSGGIQVPGNAVWADEEGRKNVWLVVEGEGGALSVTARPVEVGEMQGSEIGILDGIRPGDTIVTSGVQQVREGGLVSRYAR